MGEAPDNGTARAGRKWVHGLPPDAPAQEAARLVVGARLRRPGELLAEADADAGRTPDKVHQLRVATRRAQAALDAFEPALDGEACARARKAMRRIRRAAGPARACDVHLELFGQRVRAAAASRCAAIGFVLGRIAVERERAQAPIERAGAKWTPKRLARLRDRAVRGADAAPEDQGAETAGALGARAVAASRARLAEASRANLRAFDNLHELRKVAKAMRYTLEIFRDCMAPEEFERLYGRATETHRRLGDLNDAHEMLGRVGAALSAGALPAPVAPALRDLRDQLERERDLAHDRFLDWWSTDRAIAAPVIVVAPASVGAPS